MVVTLEVAGSRAAAALEALSFMSHPPGADVVPRHIKQAMNLSVSRGRVREGARDCERPHAPAANANGAPSGPPPAASRLRVPAPSDAAPSDTRAGPAPSGPRPTRDGRLPS